MSSRKMGETVGKSTSKMLIAREQDNIVLVFFREISLWT